MKRRIVAALAVVLLACGCPKGPVVQAVPWPEPKSGQSLAEAPAEPAPTLSAEAMQMHARFETVSAMKDAVIAGDVARAQFLAATLNDDLQRDPGPEAWRAHVEALTKGSLALTRATADTVPKGVAGLAGTCGQCHLDTGARPKFSEAALPRRGAPAQVMQQHAWAAARMYEGLVGPTTDRWLRGTATFVVLPRCDAPASKAPDTTRLCEQTQLLARQAHLAETQRDRAALYGQLLATCAGCHRARGRTAKSGA